MALPRRAAVEPIRKSQLSASDSPVWMAGPLIAARVSLSRLRIARLSPWEKTRSALAVPIAVAWPPPILSTLAGSPSW